MIYIFPYFLLADGQAWGKQVSTRCSQRCRVRLKMELTCALFCYCSDNVAALGACTGPICLQCNCHISCGNLYLAASATMVCIWWPWLQENHLGRVMPEFVFESKFAPRWCPTTQAYLSRHVCTVEIPMSIVVFKSISNVNFKAWRLQHSCWPVLWQWCKLVAGVFNIVLYHLHHIGSTVQFLW